MAGPNKQKRRTARRKALQARAYAAFQAAGGFILHLARPAEFTHLTPVVKQQIRETFR